MAPPNQDTTMLMITLSVLASSLLVQAQSPFYFSYQPQQHGPQYQQHGTYQPFTSSPPATYFQPTYQSPDENYYNRDLSPTPPPANHLVTYPTQTQASRGPQQPVGRFNNLPFQPIENSIVQQTPNASPTPDTGSLYRAPFSNHHTHIVNGLPRQQFFGNNYEFFRTRHGLGLPSTVEPFLQQNSLSTAPATAAPPQQSPTVPAIVSTSTTSTAVQPQPTKTSETKENSVKQLASISSPPPPKLFSHFLFSHGPFSPVPNHSIKAATTPLPPRTLSFVTSAASPTTPPPALVSPSFAFSQFFPETDTHSSNELERQPLFGADDDKDDEEEEDDDEENNRHTNNGKSVLHGSQNTRQPHPQLARIVPQSPTTSQQSPNLFKSPQTYSSNGGSLNSLVDQSKDEPVPIRIHNTTPIRIVFNYDQAIEALQENPGVRVVIAHTEKNNLTQEEEFTTPRPYQVPVTSTTTRPTAKTNSPYVTSQRTFTESYPYQTTPRYVSSPSPQVYQASAKPILSSNFYQPTTTRTLNNYGTYRPAPRVLTTTQRPLPSPPSRLEYQSLSVPYTSTAGTTATELENLALELEGRFDKSNRVSPRPIYETVATFATESPSTESPLQTVRRGSKKYVVVPSSGNVYKAQEPRVVVNDLANIVVQSVPPRYTPTQPTYPSRVTFPEYEDDDELGQPIGENLRQEIDNLNEQLRQEFQTTTTTSTTTSTTTPRPPPPSSRIRVSPTPRLLRITTYRPPGTYRTSPRPISSYTEDDERNENPNIPEDNSVSSAPPPSSTSSLLPSQSPRYYYNNKSHTGLSGAHQRYEYNGIDAPPIREPQHQRSKSVVRRRQRVRGRLIAGSPPRPVQVSDGPPGSIDLPEGVPPPVNFGAVGPVPIGAGPLSPVPPGVSLPGAVFRVGPRGRLLRRKSRPRPQIINQQSSVPIPPSLSPSPASIPDLPPVPQELQERGQPPPPQFPSLYSPTPFVPTSLPLVTTYRPGPTNLLQNFAAEVKEVQRERANVGPGPDTPDPTGTFRSRFRFNPTRPSPPITITQSDEEDKSNQYDSDEDSPAPVPQRRRPQSTTSTTTEGPTAKQVISDRANILQRQIRFNRNKARSNQKIISST